MIASCFVNSFFVTKSSISYCPFRISKKIYIALMIIISVAVGGEKECKNINVYKGKRQWIKCFLKAVCPFSLKETCNNFFCVPQKSAASWVYFTDWNWSLKSFFNISELSFFFQSLRVVFPKFLKCDNSETG